jgi:hypothetical protein
MNAISHKAGAVFYGLWGLLHIVGALALLLQLSAGAGAVLATIGSATPAAEVPAMSGGLAEAVLAYYAWNLLWIGVLVTVVAVRFNWRNDPAGFWLNLVVVSAVDLGLVVTLVLPGHMALADGLMGIVLWLPAVFFSTWGFVRRPSLLAARAPVPGLCLCIPGGPAAARRRPPKCVARG